MDMAYLHTHAQISIHALREEGDHIAAVDQHIPSISIHALREEGDTPAPDMVLVFILFLSTPSARRATRQAGIMAQLRQISIHALREEGDTADLPPCRR